LPQLADMLDMPGQFGRAPPRQAGASGGPHGSGGNAQHDVKEEEVLDPLEMDVDDDDLLVRLCGSSSLLASKRGLQNGVRRPAKLTHRRMMIPTMTKPSLSPTFPCPHPNLWRQKTPTRCWTIFSLVYPPQGKNLPDRPRPHRARQRAMTRGRGSPLHLRIPPPRIARSSTSMEAEARVEERKEVKTG
jgi:hypothetical protein